MAQETLSFRILVSVKDKAGNITKLTKQVNLKIDWKTDQWGTKGFLNPKREKYIRRDGTHDPSMDSWKSGGEVIQFEKDGKKYDILVKFTVKKGWCRDRTGNKSFSPFPRSAPFEVSNTGDERERKSMEYAITPTYRRKEGYIIVSVVVVIVLGAIFLYAWQKHKKEKQRNYS